MHSFRLSILLFLAFATATPCMLFAQAPSEHLPDVYVEVDPDSLQYILDRYWADHFISVQVRMEGRAWTDVRMRIRGDSSRGRRKKSFKLEFEGAPLPDGTRTMNLNADFQDPSYLHSVLSTMLIRRSGQPVFQAQHVNLFVNDAFYGLYVQVENMDAAFLAREGMDPQGNLYKATLDGAAMSPFDDVEYHWEKKTNENEERDDLRRLIQRINAVPQSEYEALMREAFDYDALLNALVMNMLIANGSTYYHNYYLYRDVRGTGRWTFLHWDHDFTLSSYGVSYSYQRSSGPGTPDNPLLERAILSESILSDMRARIEELHTAFFNLEALEPVIDSLAVAIEASVALDTLDQVDDLSAWRAAVAAEKDFLRLRASLLLEQIDTHPRSFRLERDAIITADSLTFRWGRAHDPDGNPVHYTFWMDANPAFTFGVSTRINELSDTVLTIPAPAPGRYFWHVQASDGTHVVDGYDTWNVIYVGEPVHDRVVINEVAYLPSEAFSTDDWVELYNPFAAPVDLSGWAIGDARNRFLIPDGTTLPGEGYLIVARNIAAFRAVHGPQVDAIGSLGFGFGATGERVLLLDPAGTVVDSVAYAPAAPWPDLSGQPEYTIELIDPALDNANGTAWAPSLVPGGSPGYQNGRWSGETGVDELHVQASIDPNYPNPFRGATRIPVTLPAGGLLHLQVYDVLGRRIAVLADRWQEAGQPEIEWDASGVAPGVYVIRASVNGQFVGSQVVTVLR